MSRGKQSIEKAILDQVPSGARLLLAVSGGKDSVSLLHSCVALKDRLKLYIHVAHLDHGLRASSKRDAQFVRSLAKNYDLPFSLQVEKGPSKGQNTEKWGRETRYAFFGELLRKKGLDYVLTAHTADDVAETFLMRLLANKELRSIERLDERRKCLRPLLEVSREEIEKYVLKHKLQYVHDETNDDLSYLRNRVRHLLIPFMKTEFEPRIVEVLAGRALMLAEDNACLSRETSSTVQTLVGHRFGSKAWLKIIKVFLDKLPMPIAWRLVEAVLYQQLKFNIGCSTAKRVIPVIQGQRNAVQIEGGFELRRVKGELRVIRAVNGNIKSLK